MKKKLMSVCIATALMCPYAVLADVEEVRLKGNNCYVSGTASKGDTVTVLLTKSKTDADNADNAINFCSEELSDDVFDLKLPILEDKMGDSSDLTVYVRVGDGERKEFNLTYYPESELEAVIEKLDKAGSAEDMKKIIDSAENEELLKALGFNLEQWDDCDKDNAVKVFYANRNCLDGEIEGIIDNFDIAVLLSSYGKDDAVKITDALDKISPIKYEKLIYSVVVQIADKENICNYIEKNAPYESTEELNVGFAKACAYADLKASDSYGKVQQTLEFYEDVLNLSDEKYYSYYNSNKTAVAKKVMSLLTKTDIASEADFHELMQTAVDEVKNSKKTNNSSSSGGGGGGGGGSYASPIIAPVVENTVGENDTEDTESSVSQSFGDLASTHWAFNAVEELHKAGVINGYTDGSFKPDKKVTREEFVTMLLNALEIQCTGGSTPFRDIENGKWYTTYVATAYSKELVSGVGRNEFGLGKEITRQDIAAILLRARELYPEAVREYTAFADDGDVSEYAKEAVKVMYEQGVISGSDGYFNPKKSASRAETAMMLYNFINLPEVQAEQ